MISSLRMHIPHSVKTKLMIFWWLNQLESRIQVVWFDKASNQKDFSSIRADWSTVERNRDAFGLRLVHFLAWKMIECSNIWFPFKSVHSVPSVGKMFVCNFFFKSISWSNYQVCSLVLLNFSFNLFRSFIWCFRNLFQVIKNLLTWVEVLLLLILVYQIVLRDNS